MNLRLFKLAPIAAKTYIYDQLRVTGYFSPQIAQLDHLSDGEFYCYAPSSIAGQQLYDFDSSKMHMLVGSSGKGGRIKSIVNFSYASLIAFLFNSLKRGFISSVLMEEYYAHPDDPLMSAASFPFFYDISRYYPLRKYKFPTGELQIFLLR